MSEQQEQINPIDSVSNVSSKKKTRPGKAQRAAAKLTSQASSVTGVQSVGNATTFAKKAMYEPIPQPGKFPIVFPAGAGEPTRDVFVALEGETLRKSLEPIASNYANSSRYAEFASHAEVSFPDFSEEVVVSSLLGIAQHVVHAHLNLGLPMGDFSAVSSTDMYNPSGVRAIIRQFGEFAVESLGTRYLYKSYESEVTALIRTAKRIKEYENGAFYHLLDEHWLPTKVADARTTFIVASRVREYFAGKGLSIPIDDLNASVFTKPPGVYNAMETVLTEAEKEGMANVFKPWTTKKEFVDIFRAKDGFLLDALQLKWSHPQEKHLLFQVVPKVVFAVLADTWLKKKPVYTKFFSCSTGSIEKAEARGSPTQLGVVKDLGGVLKVESLVAVSAPEFSLLACFPSTMVYPECPGRNVVLTTSLPIAPRVTEFLQRDWL